MFITFHCDAYENISYFNDVGTRLLHLMGHSGTVPGALKGEEVAGALASLQRGVGQEATTAAVEDDEQEPEIGLAKRAIPLLSLLQAAANKNCSVVWESAKSPG